MIFVVLTIVSSVLVSVVIRVNEGRGGSRLVVAAMNYVMAASLSVLFLVVDGGELVLRWVLVGTALGIGFVAGFLLMMKGINDIGLAIPTSAARLSMLVPVVGSMLIYAERPDTAKIVGIVVGFLGFAFLGISQRRAGRSQEHRVGIGGVITLVLLFIVVGSTDFTMKASLMNGADNNALTLVIFASAAVLCWLVVVVKKLSVSSRDVRLGLILGIPNFCSVLFLLLALRVLDASRVFPAVSAGAVVLVTVVAAVVWRERPNRPAAIGLALSGLALALLA